MSRMEEISVKEEVEKRLADIFDESEGAPGALDVERVSDESPLRDLKAVVLSVDWEINDETLTRLEEEIDRLKTEFGDDKVLFLFLQLLASIARYVKANRARSHPDAVKLLNSCYLKMEKVFLSGELSEEGRKRILLAELRKFKVLKERIAQLKTASARTAQSGAAAQGGTFHDAAPGKAGMAGGASVAASFLSDMPPQEALAWAVQEIKKAIHAEFESLRAELRHLKR